MNISTLYFIIILVITGESVSHAQDSSEKPKAKFSCLMIDELPMDKLFYKDGSKYEELTLKKGKRSKLYDVGRAKVFELYKLSQSEEGESVYELVGAAPLVAGGRNMLFFISLAEDSAELPLKVRGLDDSLEGFPPGSFRFINFTKEDLLVKVRDKVSKLKAEKISVVSSGASKDGGMVPVTYGNTKGEKLYFTRLYSHSRSREMVFIGESKDPQRRLKFVFVPQNIPSK